MTTEKFIEKVEEHLENNVKKDKDGNIVKSFKVLFGEIKSMRGSLQLTSVYPVSAGMSVLFASDRVVYYEKELVIDPNNSDLSTSSEAIYIAVNTNTFNEAEEHDFIKTLGHPTNYQAVVGNPDEPNRGYFF